MTESDGHAMETGPEPSDDAEQVDAQMMAEFMKLLDDIDDEIDAQPRWVGEKVLAGILLNAPKEWRIPDWCGCRFFRRTDASLTCVCGDHFDFHETCVAAGRG